MDLSKVYKAGAAQQLPDAALCFDRFHLTMLANEALEQVRRAEVKQSRTSKAPAGAPVKDARNSSREQINNMHWLSRSNLKTACAWRIKEALRSVVNEDETGG